MSLCRAALTRLAPISRRAPVTIPLALTLARPSSLRIAPLAASFARTYASGTGLSKEDITERVLDVMRSFEKVDPTKLKTQSSFAEDLGLDSLDAVEVVMAVEEEFSIEIPDAEADEIKTVQEAIDYISKTPEAT